MSIDKDTAVSVVRELVKLFSVESVMTFGGEPLLFADTVCAIHKAATEVGIPKRQIITNGFFSTDSDMIAEVAKTLNDSGVISLLLSVDAFHQEYIPVDKVYEFAKALCSGPGISDLKLHPAWLVNRGHDNPYNKGTETCLARFSDLGIPVSNGNCVFPDGNAGIYLKEYFIDKPLDLDVKCGENPYTDPLDNIKTVSVNPNGDILICCFIIGNVYKERITDILERYDPYSHPLMSILLESGVKALIEYAEDQGVTVDTSQHYSTCSLCRDIVGRLTPEMI